MLKEHSELTWNMKTVLLFNNNQYNLKTVGNVTGWISDLTQP